MDFLNKLIEDAQRVNDWVHGRETGVPDDRINPQANWKAWRTKDEPQSIPGVFDTSGCTNFSCLHTIQARFWYMIRNNLFPEAHMNWLDKHGYFDDQGKPNFSERQNYKVSGTTPQGNHLQASWDGARTAGLVPEAMWPFPYDEIRANPSKAYEIYTKPLPPEVIALGLEFKKYFSVVYEWVATPANPVNPNEMMELLKTAPIQIGTLVCSGWYSQSPINGCGPGSQHATCLVGVIPATAYEIFDQYPDYDKRLALNYSITWGIRGLLKPVGTPTTKFTYEYKVNLYSPIGQSLPASPEVHALQEGLQALGYMQKGVFGSFSTLTRTALLKFQLDNKIAGGNGCNWGPLSRAKMTELLLKQ